MKIISAGFLHYFLFLDVSRRFGREQDGSLILLWKQLKSMYSQKLKDE